jgi:hypothetical protein
MRRRGLLSLVCVCAMLALAPAVGGQTPDVPDRVDRAITLLLSPDRSDAQCADGLLSLLDAIAEAAPAARIDGPWPAKVAAARARLAGGQMGEAVPLLNDSYRLVYGKAFAMPATVRSLADARDHIRKQLSSVRGLMGQGRADEAVRRMLDAAVMIVTPIEA